MASVDRSRLERLPRPVLVASHRRSGTHLLIDLLRRQFAACRSWKWPLERTTGLYLDTGWLARGHVTAARALRILDRPAMPIVKSHELPGLARLAATEPAWAAWLSERARVLAIVRDGRDVMRSLHAYMGDLDPAARVPIGPFMAQPNGLPELREPADEALDRPAAWARHVRAWRSVPEVLLLRYEDLVKRTPETLERIGSHLGLEPLGRTPLLPPRPRSMNRFRIVKALSMRPVSTAILASDVQRNRGKWWDHFQTADRRLFHDRAGDLLIELGYERDAGWVEAGGRPVPLGEPPPAGG